MHETNRLSPENRLQHTLVTPSAQSDAAISALRAGRAPHRSQRDAKLPLILVIEDDVLLRSLLVEWLTADGYRVDVANDVQLDGLAAGAATSAASQQAKAELMIVDVFMPRGPGIERLRLTRLAYPRVPIMAISGQFNPGVDAAGAAAAELDVDCVVAKPFEREVLIDAVRSLIGRPR